MVQTYWDEPTNKTFQHKDKKIEIQSLIKMATAEQVQQMIDLMKAQMEQIAKLQTENEQSCNYM